MNFIGIDPSLTGTGFICLDEEGEIKDQELIKTTPAMEIEDRLKTINNIIQTCINKYEHSETIIYMENLSFGAKGNAIMQLAGLHYFLRINLYNKPIVKFDIIPPTVLKKFITGKGSAKKELMLLEVYKRWGVSFSDNNLADSYSLARMAYDDFINGNLETK